MKRIVPNDRSLRILLILILCSIAPRWLAAQLSTGMVEGNVTDRSGAVVADATITARNQATQIARTTTSNEVGLYVLPNLQAGTYQVSVAAKGFAEQVASNVVVSVGAKQEVSFSLAVGNVSEKVEVTDAVSPVELAAATIRPVVDSTTIVNLPLNGRDWTQLANLEPGVAAVRTQSAVAVSNQRANRGVGNQATISGSRPQGNNYRVDGISINDYSNGGPGGVLGANLGVDAIQEFSVVTGNATADYGKTSGGVINAVTRAGSNEFHGDAYEFLRNSALDARNEFDLPGKIAPFRRNQFGASIGGPLIKNHTFFFGDYEGLRQYQSTNVASNVPTQAARSGQLVAGTVTVDPKVVPYFTFYPLPNGPVSGDTGQFLFNDPTTTNENYFTVRIDHTLDKDDSLSGTYFFDRGTLQSPDPFDVKLLANFDRRQMASISETHIFSTSVLNSVRFGYSRVVSIAPTTVSAINPAAADISLGFAPGLPVGLINIGGVSNFQGGLGAVGTFAFHYNSYQFYDDVSMTHGKHFLQFGFAFERLQNNQLGTANPNGQFIFSNLRTFLLNEPTSFNAPISSAITPRDLRQSVFGAYFNDDWHILPNLTLNIGLRYEPVSVPTETANRIANLPTLTSPAPPLGSPYFQNPSRKNFAPRVGFSWDPFKKGITAVRGAYGIYDALPLNYLFEGLSIFGAPFFQQGNVTGLAAGTFPTTAYGLLTSNRLRYSYNQSNPARSYVQQWSLNFQQQIPGNTVVQLGYFGSHGVHLPYRVDDVNTVQPISSSNGEYLFPTPRGSGILLNPNIGQISALFWTGYSNYNALQVKVNRTMTRRLQASLAYTWAKSIDDGSSSTFGDTFANSVSSLPLFAPDRRRGVSDFDVPQNFVVNVLYQLPKFQSTTAWLISGWQLGGIFQASSGLPFTPLVSGDPLGLKSADTFDFPDRLQTSVCSGNAVNPQNRFHYIKTECFVFPNPGTRLGDSGRNSLFGPGLQDLDFSLVKNNPVRAISETFNVQFRAEFFNILNRVNYATPLKASTQLFSQAGAAIASAGTLTQTATSSRQMQFALKVIF
ncbi:MAG TPA: TonB-dependent receptor [Terriglobales bacterium]|nr:TonB-dependent receptor [Terriglobales bacterium]